MSTAVITIVSKNYLPFARALMRTIERHSPSWARFVVLTDEVDGFFDPAAEPFTTILSSDLPIPQNGWLHFKYSILELNTAIKPYALEYLARHFGVSRLVYLDPDNKVYRPLDPVLRPLDSEDILLTPHLLDPIDDGLQPSELDILRAGAYNLGFIGLRVNQNTLRFLGWWQEKVRDHCYVDFEQGLFTDQRWMDLAPGMFPNVGILRDPGCNVAYWNLKTRPISRGADGGHTAAGLPLYFFHFSGLDLRAPEQLSRHETRFRVNDLDAARELVWEHIEDVFAEGYGESQRWPYAYGQFRNGVPVSERMRRLSAQCPELMQRMPEPFAKGAYDEYVDYWNSPAPDRLGNPSCLTQLAYAIYSTRPDLQSQARDIFGKDLPWFLDWFVHNAQREYGLEDALNAPMVEAREQHRKSTESTSKQTAPAETTPVKRIWRRALSFASGARAREERATARPRRPAEHAREEPGINIVGYLRAEMGVGEASRCAVAAARSAGLGISLCNIGLTDSRQQDFRSGEIDNRFRYDINLFNVNADQTEALFDRLEARHLAGKYNIGYWAWELDEFPERWKSAFDHYDEIWTPSTFCQDSIARVSPIPVVRIPHAIEVEVPDSLDQAELGLPADKFLFLAFLDVLSVPKRKNVEGAIAAFRQAGVSRRGGHLAIKINNGRMAPDVVRALADGCPDPEITIIDEIWPRERVNALIHRADCVVSLHRSEGFGLTIAEAMYSGKPVIVTAYSGNMDFTHHDTAMLVDYSLVPVGDGAAPYDSHCRWAEPEVDMAAGWMDRVARDGEWRERIGQAGRRYVREHFSAAIVGGMIRNRINRISDVPQGSIVVARTARG